MLAPANYCFLYQELCLFVCLQPVKMLHSAPLKTGLCYKLLSNWYIFEKLIPLTQCSLLVEHNFVVVVVITQTVELIFVVEPKHLCLECRNK